MERTKMPAFFWLPSQSKTSLKEQNSYVHSFLLVLSKVTVLMRVSLFCTTVQIVVLRFKVLILISPTFQWHMLTPSESTLLSRPCIDSLLGFCLSVMHLIIQMFSLVEDSVSVHHPIIQTGLRYLTPIFLSVEMMAHFIFNS